MASRFTVVAVLALTLALSSCGDDDGGALSKDEYIAQGDALCQQFMDETEALGEPSTVQELITMMDAAIDLADETHAGFSDLEPPPDGESVHERLLSSLEESTDKMREARDHAADGDQAGFTAAVDEAVAIGGASDEPAKDYGFEVCGSEEDLRADG